MSALLAFAAIAAVLVVLHVSTMALTAHALGHTPSTVSLFFGPVVFRRRLGSVQLQLGALPLGGFVQFAGEAGLRVVPPLRRLFLLVSGNLALAGVGLALSSGPYLLSRAEFVEVLSTSPPRALGWAALAFAVVNLMPLPHLNGGQMLEAVLSLVFGREVRSPTWLAPVGMLFSLAALVWWVVR